MHTKFYSGKLEGKRPLKRSRRGVRIMLKLILNEEGESLWTGFSKLMTRSGGGLL
jgi:hypothetical protein